MVQARVKAGKLAEQSLIRDGWISNPIKPTFKWGGTGRNNIQKIKNCNYDPKIFSILTDSSLKKYDIYNPTTNKYREIKGYNINQLNKWVLYSEPYFKVSTRSQAKLITQDVYNDFLHRFTDHANNIGLIKHIEEQMVSSNEGIQFKDGFIPQYLIEFRTIISYTEWLGYNRLQIQFKIK
jgi:hypothetical protein